MKPKDKRLEVDFQPGDVIFREGDEGNHLYIVSSGDVEISKEIDDEKVILVKLKAGDMFGEMVMVGSNIRSGTATALSPTSCISINRMMFRKKMADVPEWMQKFFGIMVERLRETTRRFNPKQHRPTGHQIVEALAILLNEGETDHHGKVYLPWDNLEQRIRYILAIPDRQVTMALEMLANTEIAGYEVESGEERRFMVNSPDQFQQFAQFLRQRFIAREKKMTVPESQPLTDEEYGVLQKAVALSERGEQKLQALDIAEFEKGLADRFDLSPEEIEKILKTLDKMGVIREERTQKKKPVRRVDLAKCSDKITAFQNEKIFNILEEKVMAHSALSVPQRKGERV